MARSILTTEFIFCGGGIDTTEKANRAWNSGADCIVVGNTIEKNPELLIDFCKSR
jgi:heptaprenylglyceryl phosphate synthase